MTNNSLQVGIYLEEGAIMPTRAYVNDVGYDLYALNDVTIQMGTFVEVKTGVHLALPSHVFAQVNTRSSFGKRGLYIHHGVIDPGYTGEVTLWIMNVSNSVLPNGMVVTEPCTIHKGDKVAQLLFHKAVTPVLSQIDNIPETERGDKGHGSSGK